MPYLETYEATCATVRRIAHESFAAHRLHVKGEGDWLCRRDGTGIYSFRVIVRPSAVIVYGDVGEGIFRGGEAGDTLAWLKSAVRSPGYLLEKLRTKPERTFYPDDALDYARESAADSELSAKILEEAEDRHQWGDLNAHTWPQLVSDAGADGEYCSVGFNYGGSELWLVEALRCFVRLIQAADEGAS